jgi:hypothetical protein
MKKLKKINTVLFQNIVETEFLLVSSKLRKNIYNSGSETKLRQLKFSATYSLEIFELLKNLKQLVRLLQFFFKSKGEKDNTFSICSGNKQIINVLDLCKKEFIFDNGSVSIINDFTRMKRIPKKTQMLLLLEEPLKSNTESFKRLLEKNIFLITKINSKKEFENSGTYKIYNDVSNFKKLAFLIAIISQLTDKNGCK